MSLFLPFILTFPSGENAEIAGFSPCSPWDTERANTRARTPPQERNYLLKGEEGMDGINRFSEEEYPQDTDGFEMWEEDTQPQEQALPPDWEEPEEGKKCYGRPVREVFDWLEAVVYALVTIFVLFAFVFRVVGVSGSSMEPTLHNADWLAISHLNYHEAHGDIIVVTRAQELNKPLIKRVVGLPGDVVNIDFERGVVTVNGEEQQDGFTMAPTHRQGDVQFPVTVPEGYVFVLGDNRNDSLDSRYSEVGFIDQRYIMGKVILRVFPFQPIQD